jgi:thioredoxin reductase (NADPH)
MILDVLIIGAGPAGLTAAIYLGRFRRPALIIDGNASRARWIPESHNIPGFTHGVGGTELLSRLRAQAEKYGATVVPGWVRSLTREKAGFLAEVEGETIHARYVLLTTGVEDTLPSLDGAEEAILRSLLRVCAICDGFEAIDKRIAVIGDGSRGEHEADFLRRYSSDVSYVYVGNSRDPGRRRRLRAKNIDLVETELKNLVIRDDALELKRPSGTQRVFDVFYVALGCRPRIELASALGAASDDNHALRVNEHQQTSVDRLYAAGDNVRGLNQVIIAAAEAALAATDIHNRLRATDR